MNNQETTLTKDQEISIEFTNHSNPNQSKSWSIALPCSSSSSPVTSPVTSQNVLKVKTELNDYLTNLLQESKE